MVETAKLHFSHRRDNVQHMLNCHMCVYANKLSSIGMIYSILAIIYSIKPQYCTFSYNTCVLRTPLIF